MKTMPRIGLSSEREFVVGPEQVIDFARDGMPAVLCTPALVGFLEATARKLLEDFLEPGEQTVGGEIELRHLAPTPAGGRVTCLARVIRVDGSLVTFQVEARDEVEMIARGVHGRRVIAVDRFARAVQRKTTAAKTS